MTNQTKNTGKIPPQAVDIEEAILGAIMLERDALLQIIDVVRPETFYKNANRVIFEAILERFNRNEPVDLLTVTAELRHKGKLEEAGGAYYVTEITSRVSSAANIEYHARIISEMHMKREMIEIASKILKESYDDTADVFDIMGAFDSGMSDVANHISSGKIFTVSSLFQSFLDKLNAAAKKPNGVTGIPTGYPAMDKMTGGWQNSDLIIVAARPSMGKTDLAINFAYNAAKAGFKSAIFSLEMSKEQLMDRVVAIDKEIDRENIKRGRLTEDEWDRLSRFDKAMMEHMLIADEPILTSTVIRAKARRLVMGQGVNLIIVDYLQLMDSTGKGNSNERVSEISRALKMVGKECNVPVIALAQLSRAVETRGGDKRPQLSDIRDSGSIEQDADIVIFPYRPQYYGIDSRADGTSTHQLMEVDFAKNRSGGVDTVDLRYLGKFGKVTDWVEPHIVESVKQEAEWVHSFPVSSSDAMESWSTVSSGDSPDDYDDDPF